MTNRPVCGQSKEVAAAREPETPSAPAAISLRELFDMHGGYVWNTLRRLGIPESDLEDLTHDVFVQVSGRLGDYDPKRPPRPWLFGFAFRVASQYRRRAHRRHETPGDPDMARHPGPSPHERLAADDDRKLVLAALEAIDLQRRAVFILYEIDRVPMEEIAGAIGVPVNTAYSRLRIARAEFRAAVERLRARRGDR
jgi:RNA polymerase sigma-70 factor (ECF subfamily)